MSLDFTWRSKGKNKDVEEDEEEEDEEDDGSDGDSGISEEDEDEEKEKGKEDITESKEKDMEKIESTIEKPKSKNDTTKITATNRDNITDMNVYTDIHRDSNKPKPKCMYRNDRDIPLSSLPPHAPTLVRARLIAATAIQSMIRQSRSSN